MTSFQRRTVIVTCLATAMFMLDTAVVNVAIPRIGHDLHSGLTGLQWVVDACTAILAACVLTAGSLADRLGRRFGLRVGLGVFTVASVEGATAMSITTEVAVLADRREPHGVVIEVVAAVLAGP